jgi:2-hydroxy-6-oxonona-2,4-dienedioate hydrolase
MPTLTIEDCELHYEVIGEGAPVVITPGGRIDREFVRPLAEELAGEFQVLLWDRRNTGRSDVFIGGGGSEQEIWADDLAKLLDHVGMAPAWVAGGSAGCRVSLLTAIRHPEVVKGLVLWSASGGAFGATYLGYNYHVPYVLAARHGGMAEVIETPFFAERIAANPRNRERLLALDPEEFIAVMKRWNEFFMPLPGSPLVGATEAELRAITAPTLIFEGNDDIHPPEPAEAIHALVAGSQFAASPWTGDEWRAGPLPQLYTRLAPEIADFIRKTEAA